MNSLHLRLAHSNALLLGACIAASLALLVKFGVTMIGQQLIESAYYGQSFSAVNSLIAGQQSHPVSEYLAAFDSQVTSASLGLVALSLLLLLAHHLPSRFRRWFPCVIVSATTIIHTIVVIAKNRLTLPIEDHLMVVGLLGSYREGTLTFAELWRPYNDVHRMIFPKLEMLLLANISDFNVTLELAFNAFLLALVLALLLRDVARQIRIYSPRFAQWLIFALCVFAFSLAQWENFFLPMQWFILTISIVFGMLLLRRPGFGAYIASLGSGTIAAFSSANGLLFWPIGFGMLLLDVQNLRRPGQWLRPASFVCIWSLVYGLYFFGLGTPGGQRESPISVGQPLAIIQFVLSYLGSPLIASETYSCLIGAVGLIVFSGLAVRTLTARPNVRSDLAPYLGIALFSIGSGMMTALGRLQEFGMKRALESSYVTVGLLFWIGLTVLAFISATAKARASGTDLPIVSNIEKATLAGVTAAILLSIWSSLTTRLDAAIWMQSHKRGPAVAHVTSLPPEQWSDDMLTRLSGGNPGDIKQSYLTIRAMHLATFSQ